jgi:hypothetical protein
MRQESRLASIRSACMRRSSIRTACVLRSHARAGDSAHNFRTILSSAPSCFRTDRRGYLGTTTWNNDPDFAARGDADGPLRAARHRAGPELAEPKSGTE